MASKKKEIRQAAKDGTITKQENRTLNAAGVTPDRLQNFQTRQETISNVGKKFGTGDFKALKDSDLSNNKILKVAAGTGKVNAKASNKLTGLNPGIKLPSKQSLTYGSPQGAGLYLNADPYNRRVELAESLEGLGKKYLQWQGTDAKGRPQALGGFKVPKNLRKVDQNNPLGISQKALKRGTFSAYDGSGTLFGRDGSSVLGGDGKMKNRPASWMPGKGGNGTGSGKKKGGKGEGEMGGMEMPSYGDSGESSSTGGLSGIFGGTGTETYGSPTFRRRRSRAQRSGSFTQGPSRLGINLQRQSGLNIMRA